MSAVMPKRNFATLDAIRGIAAICVMGFHYALLDPNIPFRFSNAFIDVDMFFCLSGFVLMQAYGNWAENSRTITDFVKIRMIRLYPMYIVGAVIGIAAFVSSSTALFSDDASRATLSVLLAILMLPDMSGTVHIPSSIINGIYPFNVPAWSLFFELIGNVALVARRWNRVSLLALIALAGMALAISSMTMRTMNGGFDASTMLVGLLRMSYNFAVGALLLTLYQKGMLGRVAVPPILPIAAVIWISAILPASGKLDIAICILLIPMIIASSTVDPRSKRWISFFHWLGNISYPLYAIHYPLVLLALQIQRMHMGRTWIIGSCAVVAILLSDVLARTLDPMARKFLWRSFVERPAPAFSRASEWAKKV